MYWCLTVTSKHPNDNNKLLNLLNLLNPIISVRWTSMFQLIYNHGNKLTNPQKKGFPWENTTRWGVGSTQDVFSLPLCCTETLQVACRGRGQETQISAPGVEASNYLWVNWDSASWNIIHMFHIGTIYIWQKKVSEHFSNFWKLVFRSVIIFMTSPTNSLGFGPSPIGSTKVCTVFAATSPELKCTGECPAPRDGENSKGVWKGREMNRPYGKA